MMDIETKVNELLPDLEEFLDEEQVRKLDESSTLARVLLDECRTVSDQWRRNKKLTEKVVADYVKNYPRETKKLMGDLEEIIDLIDQELDNFDISKI